MKASDETNAEVGDRANDAVRVNGNELRCKVVGEGGNLGFTQLGRIEYANRGRAINTDAIDNSAGVDCSDHEVNIKILLGASSKRRDAEPAQHVLAEMTEEVSSLVLRTTTTRPSRYRCRACAVTSFWTIRPRLIRHLEKAGRLDRAVEFLPSDEEIGERKAAKLGLTSPERAVLLAYSKMELSDELDRRANAGGRRVRAAARWSDYFPALLRKKRYAWRDAAIGATLAAGSSMIGARIIAADGARWRSAAIVQSSGGSQRGGALIEPPPGLPPHRSFGRGDARRLLAGAGNRPGEALPHGAAGADASGGANCHPSPKT